ncbi:glycosyltransferase family 2 protein [Candidatus Roizmanbacteria bacterium]|nr:glycosyltransferase family 2 protein [Candidatus Roizmanbacteria bacterium]
MATNSLDLSIIIISFNTRQTTLNCLRSVIGSLKNSPLKYEILVVDNASTDGSQEKISLLRRDFGGQANFKIILNKENVGFAKANNQAVRMANGAHILLLNSDTVVLDDAITAMYNFIVQNSTVHFLGPKLFNKDMTPQASTAPFYTLPVVFAALFLKGDHWGASRSSPDKTVKSDWVSGACIMTKKEYFDKIKGFDEKIFMYMDEVDLLYRAKKAGYDTYFYPQARLIHLGSASSNGKTFPILQVYKGFLFFYRKHYSRLSLILLKIMLQLKALIALIIGYIINSDYLKKTYAEAFKLAR